MTAPRNMPRPGEEVTFTDRNGFPVTLTSSGKWSWVAQRLDDTTVTIEYMGSGYFHSLDNIRRPAIVGTFPSWQRLVVAVF